MEVAMKESDIKQLQLGGSEFYEHKSLQELIAEQGVKPITNIDQLKGDFWPEEESIEEFIETLREWRGSEHYERDL
jgi:hypothetical protein